LSVYLSIVCTYGQKGGPWELPNFEKLCGTGSNDILGMTD